MTLDNIKRFRQLGSVCAGHPEHHMTAGIETTTGPLGQGCGNSVGMAIAARWLGAHYNQPGHQLFDSNTYVLCSDGDLMEGSRRGCFDRRSPQAFESLLDLRPQLHHD